MINSGNISDIDKQVHWQIHYETLPVTFKSTCGFTCKAFLIDKTFATLHDRNKRFYLHFSETFDKLTSYNPQKLNSLGIEL